MARLESLMDAAGRLRRRETTSVQLTEACLARIDALEDRLHAWVLVDRKGAIEAARRADEEIHSGRIRGPLHGIPIGIKDLFDIQGWPTKAGTTLRADHVATKDCPVVEKLRAAGSVILGKTVTTEWASFDPPATRNPWNLDRTPGGSSSGSAAATIVGECYAAMGSQTGGSITRPASFCGLASCKPTWGLVNLKGIVPLAHHIDHPGPMARNVADVAALLQVVAGPDEEDPFAPTVVVPDYLAAIGQYHSRPRLANLPKFFGELGDNEIKRGMQQATAQLKSAGATIEDVDPGIDFDEVIRQHRAIMEIEAADYHRPWFPSLKERYGKHIAELLDGGIRRGPLELAAVFTHQQEYRERLAQGLVHCDAFLTPATVTPAPGRDSTGDPRFNGPWSYSGFPTVSVPFGLSSDGLPMSIQLVGRPFEEAKLLAIAAWCERVFAFDAEPALTS